jgi:membrane-bound serine protease (ClpP class)
MIFILTLILALLFVPWPWNLVLIGAAALVEASLAIYGVRYGRRRGRSAVGAHTMIGARAEVITALEPTGQVKLDGEIWEAHSAQGAQVGEIVRITGRRRLTLEVEPEPAEQPEPAG